MAATQYLTIWDYIVIVLALVFSSLFGLYYGIRRKKGQGTTFEYLLASKDMKMVPIAFSYFASLTSSGVVIGHPAEVYSFGIQIILLCITIIPCIFFLNEIFFPIYHRLNSGSVYEYVEIRFNTNLKNLVTGLVVFQTIFLSSANVYGPSTVLSQVTGISSWVIVVILSVLCIIYTTLGGIRAVIIADLIQAILMFISLFLLLGMGIYYVGDMSIIYDRNLITDRLNIFQMDLDLTVRQTFWNTTVGYIFTFMAITSTAQYTLQRFMTAPTLKAAKQANILGNFLFIISLILIQSVGLVMYATFHGCDPLKTKYIKNMDQLLPAYLMKVLSSYLFLPGIIFAGILSASLSTLSSVYNSTATIVMVSFVKPLWPNMPDKTATNLCKFLVLVVGILSTLGVALAELFPTVLQSVLSFASAVSAPLFAILIIGIFCPQANIKAIYASFILSFLLLVYVIIGTLVVKPTLVTKPLYADSCEIIDLNNTISKNKSLFEYETVTAKDTLSSINGTMTPIQSSLVDYFPLSSISYLWYSLLGAVSTFIIFILLTLIFGKEKSKPVSLEIIPEIVQKFHRSLPLLLRKIFLCDVYVSNPKTVHENVIYSVNL